ncbi:asparagine synthase (glutamine-hydrolysing) [Filimonas lacunae]|uniref:asparagine synthase (glutamine-hydrolyzing) n=1 Tax=Filimonas lacunae TaxID=477680 RepID=A0A173MMI3_9BACT|nr:asparagine synthase (glutamine-hydrolyzing) [Filimonas lacunae]BAV08670.1 asparagine synthetase [Filimonas lacunae]SIS59686.1 asparagine synthase (glutamine-hydrolysing) [Filimonas lacunae]
MCGIGGILYSTGTRNLLQQQITQLAVRQQHRGPDGEGLWLQSPHALCHQRLSLVDEKGSAQPFADASGRYMLVYNGEVYNYQELRRELQPYYRFTTEGDTEVVLAAWLIWGVSCVQRFTGMFAFLIWDTVTETAFAARDAVGVKPFVYTVQQQTFLFASEVKALLAVISTPAINEYALAEYVIAPYLSGDGEAIHNGICYLQPGTYLQISRGAVTTHSWYRFGWQQQQQPEEVLTAQMADALAQSVAMSLRADVPVGLFFSGGLDSSLLGAIAAEQAAYKPTAYTITFQQHHDIQFDATTIVNADDLPYAQKLAHTLQLPFHRVEARHRSLAGSLQLLAQINDRIPAWEQEFSQHFLSIAAAKKVKAVMVGDAADEINYGYFFLLKDTVNTSPLGLLNLFGGTERLGLLSPRLQRLQPLEYLNHTYRQLAAEAGYDFARGGEESVLAMSTLVHRRWLQRLLHNGDIHTMHAGLEARVPFANREVLTVASQVLPRYGFKAGMEKYVVRTAALGWLDKAYAWRKKSALPRDPRLGKGYQQVLHTLLQQRNDFVDACLHRPALEALCQLPTVTENERMMLFNMICLINWSKVYAN